MLDLIIKNGFVLIDEEIKKIDIGVLDEKIVQISENISENAKEIYDAEGKYIFNGVCDAHVHFDEPGRTEWETIETGSAAFASGGGTVYFDMPLNSFPVTCDVKTFREKLEIASKNSYTDFGLYGGLTPSNLNEIDSLADVGVIGFKAFICFTGVGGIERADDYTIYKGMEKIKKNNLPLMIHAENPFITKYLTESFVAKNKLSAKDYFNSRPIITEIESVSRMIAFAEETGCKTIIAHVSTAKAVLMIKEAQQKGINIFCETIGHYLAFDEEDVERFGTIAKCSPPIRDKKNKLEMWECIKNDKIDFVSSDHSPCEPILKEKEFLNAWGGITGCQNTLSLMLTEGYFKNKTYLNKINNLCSTNALTIYNIKNKGKTKIGFDADFAVVDLNKEFTLQKEDLLYKHKLSIYEGYNFKSKVIKTILRGKTIFEDGKMLSSPIGKMVVTENF